MSKRQIIAILMMSPFYFTMTLRQRFEVFQMICSSAPARSRGMKA